MALKAKYFLILISVLVLKSMPVNAQILTSQDPNYSLTITPERGRFEAQRTSPPFVNVVNISGSRAIEQMMFRNGYATPISRYQAGQAVCFADNFTNPTRSGERPSGFSLLRGGTPALHSVHRTQGTCSVRGGLQVSCLHLNFYYQDGNGQLMLTCNKNPGDMSAFTDQDILNIMGQGTIRFLQLEQPADQRTDAGATSAH